MLSGVHMVNYNSFIIGHMVNIDIDTERRCVLIIIGILLSNFYIELGKMRASTSTVWQVSQRQHIHQAQEYIYIDIIKKKYIHIYTLINLPGVWVLSATNDNIKVYFEGDFKTFHLIQNSQFQTRFESNM